MPRFTITREHKPVGYLECPEWRFIEGAAAIPGLEGDQHGFAVVTEIGNTPTAALIFPLEGETIELSHPVQWVSEVAAISDIEKSKLEPSKESRLADAGALLQIVGDVGVSRKGERIDVRFDSGWSSRKKKKLDYSFRLEIDDEEEKAFLHCDLRGEPDFRVGFLRARFRSSTSEGVADAVFTFDLKGRTGFAEGEFRGRLISTSVGEGGGTSDFDFFFDFFGDGRGFGEGRIRGSKTPHPLLWLIERTVGCIPTEKKRFPFRLWMGAVKYSSEPEESRVARQNIAARLAKATPLTAGEVGQIANWLVTSIPRAAQESFAETLKPVFERLTISPRIRPFSVTDFDIEFDDSVSAQEAIEFLSSLGEELAKEGGRLCFTTKRRTHDE